MGKIFAPPEGFNPPEYSQNTQDYFKACENYIKAIQRVCKQAWPTCPEAGKVISFPVADGQAVYVVYSTKPVQLIHVDTGDAYSFQYAHRLTAADIRDEIKRQETMSKLFRRK